MTLNELREVMFTNTFNLVVMEKGQSEPLLTVSNPNYSHMKEYGELKVIAIDTTTIVSKESPITHTIDIRPIIEVRVLWEE